MRSPPVMTALLCLRWKNCSALSDGHGANHQALDQGIGVVDRTQNLTIQRLGNLLDGGCHEQTILRQGREYPDVALFAERLDRRLHPVDATVRDGVDDRADDWSRQ